MVMVLPRYARGDRGIQSNYSPVANYFRLGGGC
jgi:hypothetical protein